MTRLLGDPVRAALLVAYVVLATTSLRHKSPTFDEPYHLYQGYRLLRTGDASLRVEKHPPGVQALAALPLLFRDHALPPGGEEDPRSHTAQAGQIRAFVEQDEGAVIRSFPWARSVIVLLAAVLGLLIYSGAFDLHGRGGARVALALYCFDPNMLAHGRLVTTDMGATLSAWMVTLVFLRWRRHATWRRALGLGAALGFALLAKFSSLLLLPCLVVFVAVAPVPIRRLVQLVPALGIAFLMVWAVHGFEMGTLADEDAKLSAGKRSEEAEESLSVPAPMPFASVPIPAPSYVYGFRQNLHHIYRRGHPAYLRGEYSRQGWRTYFPWVLAIKTPLPTILLIVLALGSFAVARPRREELLLLVYPALYLGLAVKGSVNIGYRHVLSILPFLFVLCGRLAATPVVEAVSRALDRFGIDAASARRLSTAGLVGLFLVLSLETLAIHPHYLAYFNRTIGGSRQGIHYVVGSNLDWGQDLPGLASWLEENGVGEIQLSYFGRVPPSHYGIRWLPIRIVPAEPERGAQVSDLPAGIYAVSASRLVELQTLGKGPLKVFQRLEPIAIIGHSIYVYEVEGYDVGERR